MSDFLSRLAERQVEHHPGPAPRLPSRFEPATSPAPVADAPAEPVDAATMAPKPAAPEPRAAVAPIEEGERATTPQPPRDREQPRTPPRVTAPALVPPVPAPSPPPAAPPPQPRRPATRSIPSVVPRPAPTIAPRQATAAPPPPPTAASPPAPVVDPAVRADPAPLVPPLEPRIDLPTLIHRERAGSPTEPAGPIAHVTIGRLEVRAVVPPVTAPEPRAPARRQAISLDEYLEGRSGARR